MNTKYLSYILIIAKRENMIKAAEELSVSQSTLSQYLSKLESELGTPFFYRSKGRPTLIATSRFYVDAAEKVMFIKNNLYRNTQNLDNRRHITIGVTSQFALRILTELIPPFKSRFLDVTTKISETDVPSLTQFILERNIDCGIMAFNTVEFSLWDQAHILRREEVFFVIPKTHSYYGINPGRPVIILEFTRYSSEGSILVFKRGSTLRCLIDQIIEAASWIPSTVCEANSIMTTRSMVAMGVGVTFTGASYTIDREHISYYPPKPRLYRLNAFMIRKNQVMNQPESTLCHDILYYLSNQG